LPSKGKQKQDLRNRILFHLKTFLKIDFQSCAASVRSTYHSFRKKNIIILTWFGVFWTHNLYYKKTVAIHYESQFLMSGYVSKWAISISFSFGQIFGAKKSWAVFECSSAASEMTVNEWFHAGNESIITSFWNRSSHYELMSSFSATVSNRRSQLYLQKPLFKFLY
jgi:hypothetical protein